MTEMVTSAHTKVGHRFFSETHVEHISRGLIGTSEQPHRQSEVMRLLHHLTPHSSQRIFTVNLPPQLRVADAFTLSLGII